MYIHLPSAYHNSYADDNSFTSLKLEVMMRTVMMIAMMMMVMMRTMMVITMLMLMMLLIKKASLAGSVDKDER